MRSRHSAFTLTCPAVASRDVRIAQIRARGNLPLLVDGKVLAEIGRADLEESWQTAVALKPAELAAMTRKAGDRLAQTLKHDVDSVDLTEVVTDAAVLFLLTMRRYGATALSSIRPCTVVWDEARSAERVVMRA